MKPKPSRPFVYLAFVMVFLLVVGLVVVGMLITSNTPISVDDFTRPAALATNSALVATSQIHVQTFTPVPYNADMSPTAALSYDLCPFYHPAPPYDPELFALRCKEMFGLITGGGPTEYARFYITETALVAEYQTMQSLTATPTSSLTMTPSPTAIATNTLQGAGFTQCAFSWARRDLPDLTAQAQTAFDKADIPATTIRAEAYGEECAAPNTVASFSAMTTDFYLTVELPNLTDQSTAVYIETVYAVLLTLPQDTMPARPGYLDITFKSGAQTRHFRAMFDPIKRALDQNLSGTNLITELGGLR